MKPVAVEDGNWGHDKTMFLESPPMLDLDPFSRFCTDPARTTDRLTDAGIVDCNSPHLMHSMRPNNNDVIRRACKLQWCGGTR